MNKVLKGLAAVAATAAMAVAGFAGASTAMAAGATTDITITDASVGDEFSAYKLLNLTTSRNADSTTNYSYTVNTKYSNVLKSAIDDLNGLTAASTDDTAILDYINNNVKENSTADATQGQVTARAFAEKVREKIATANTPTVTLEADAHASKTDSQEATFAGADQGYYLIVQTASKTDETNSTKSQVILDTHGDSKLELKVKKDTVSLEKKVQENTDGVNDTQANQWQDGADYNINDYVPFKLTGTLPTDYANYTKYQYIFHDKESAGLTFVNQKVGEGTDQKDYTVKVYADNNGTETELKQASAGDATGYQVVTTGLTEGETFNVKFADLKSVKNADGTDASITSSTKIVVKYFAKLNENAQRGAAGNPNEAWLEYSNSQYDEGEGTSKTPHDKVTVFTFNLVINKYKNNKDTTLNGAEFTLYKSTDKTNWTEVKKIKNENGSTFTFDGLDSGYYKIHETPMAGYDTLADIEFQVVATYSAEGDPSTLTNLEVKDSSGNVISGENKSFTVSAIDASAYAQIGTDVVNKSGNKLPSTGGMGTVILYVAGIAVFVLAGATLVMALRRRNA